MIRCDGRVMALSTRQTEPKEHTGNVSSFVSFVSFVSFSSGDVTEDLRSGGDLDVDESWRSFSTLSTLRPGSLVFLEAEADRDELIGLWFAFGVMRWVVFSSEVKKIRSLPLLFAVDPLDPLDPVSCLGIWNVSSSKEVLICKCGRWKRLHLGDLAGGDVGVRDETPSKVGATGSVSTGTPSWNLKKAPLKWSVSKGF